jgi:hypothetical protein
MQLTILISGKSAPTNENIDVFIRPLVEELQLLWKGIPAQDFGRPPGEWQFKLRGILISTISDYPGYGLISGVCTHGYRGCAVCGPSIESRAAKSGNKLDANQKVCGSKIVFGVLEENHVLCNRTKNDYMSYATQKRLQRPYFVSTLICTGL